jgi:hypothetical protein
MTDSETLEPFLRFVDAYNGICSLLERAVNEWPRLPEGWEGYKEHLAALDHERPAVVALFICVGHDSPADGRRIVESIIGACARAKAACEASHCPLDKLRDMQDGMREYGAYLLQFVHVWNYEQRRPASLAGWYSNVPSTAPPRETTPQDRLQFENASHTVTLDGQAYREIDPTAYLILKSIAEKTIFQGPGLKVSGGVLEKVHGLLGKKQDRELKKLPEELHAIVQGLPGSGRWIELPPLK